MRKEKIRQNDFTLKDLPKTRLEQFKDLFIHRFVTLLKLSFLQTIFLLPSLVIVIMFYIFIRGATDYNAFFSVVLFSVLGLLICIPIAYIGYIGLFHSLKLMCFMEGEFEASSFFIGIKEEWKKGLIIGMIHSLSICLTIIGITYLIGYVSEDIAWLKGFGIAILVIQLIVVTMVVRYAISEISIYKNAMRYVLKNSFLFTLMRFPINLLFVIISPGISIALISIMEITSYIGVALIIIFNAFTSLIWMLNSIATFDKYINKENNPDFYKKGLYKGE